MNIGAIILASQQEILIDVFENMVFGHGGEDRAGVLFGLDQRVWS